MAENTKFKQLVEDTGYTPGQSLIRPIIDNMTFILHNISLKQCFEHLELMDYFDDFMDTALLKEIGFGLGDKVILDFLHIKFDINRYYLQEALSREDFDISKITSLMLPKIRIEFTGTSLRYLRSTGSWHELYMMTKPFPDPDHDHLTRVDISYDLIDYRPYFLKECLDFVNDPANITDAGRIRLMRGCAGMVFDTRGGAVKTLYLGAATSDKRLRIYDKRHEQGKKLPESDFPECTSWIRLEWQTRNKVANGFHYADISDSKKFYLGVFKKIYEEYSFALNVGVGNPKPAQFWIDLWNWEEIETIIQNANFV